MTLVDGIQTAVTSGGPKFTDELFTYERVLVIDAEQHEDALLYRPVQFIADDAGNMYIFDQGIGSILAYDAAGRYTHSIGRKGFGPGETSYGQIQQMHDGIIQIYGLKDRRTARFSTDGELLDVTTVPSSIGVFTVGGMIVLPDGNQLILTSSSGTAPKGADINVGQTGDIGHQQSGAVILSPDGEMLSAVMTPSIQVSEIIQVEFAGASYNTPVPIAFGPTPMALYHPTHGIVLSTGTQSALEVFSLSGQKTRSIRIELDPEPVTVSDRNRARQMYLQNTERAVQQSGKPTDGWLEEIVNRYPFADEKAFWGRAKIDADGYFWLDLSLSPETLEGDSHSFMVLSPEGEYLGISSRPLGPSGSHIGGGLLYILEEDLETGAFIPTVYRMVPSVRGLAYPN
ncbi:hypothetical protein ACFL6T_02060 [Candidatus Zixiibacteriota bacterium]